MTEYDTVPGGDDFRGFEEARRLMACFEARLRTYTKLALTDFIEDTSIAAVHVDNISRSDRVFLLAFDRTGQQRSACTLYNDGPEDHLDLTPEFDHDLTRMTIPTGSPLAELAAAEDGWIIDMATLRRYDTLQDRRATQRAVMLAHLSDMLATGQARGFIIDGLGIGDNQGAEDDDDQEGPSRSGAA